MTNSNELTLRDTVSEFTIQLPDTTASSSEKVKDIIIAIACLTFFPVVYFIGKLMVSENASKSFEFAQSFFWM